MSKQQEIIRLSTRRTIWWVIFGISLCLSAMSAVFAALSGLALSGCRFMQYYKPDPCDTGPTDFAGSFALVAFLVAIVSVILAIVTQSQISELRAKGD